MADELIKKIRKVCKQLEEELPQLDKGRIPLCFKEHGVQMSARVFTENVEIW